MRWFLLTAVAAAAVATLSPSTAEAQGKLVDPAGSSHETHPIPSTHGALEHAETHGEHADAHGEHEVHAPAPINWTDWSDFSNKDAHGGTLEQGEEAMGPPMVFALINFAVFLGLLFWKAGPPIRGWLDTRHTSIKEALAEAAVLREQAREKLEEYDRRVSAVNDDVNRLISEIRSDAETEKQRILDEALEQSKRLKQAAEERIEAEIARARHELEREVVSVAIAAAERVLREKMTPNDHRSLVTNFIGDLGTTTDEGTV